jgi:hypothetical protein
MADLSPAAQAIMIAATNGNHNCQADPVYRQCIAAALRVVADEVASEKEPLFLALADRMRRDARNQFCAKLRAIAAELEGQQ